MRVLVCVSGGGTNLQSLIDYASRGELGRAEIVAVLSSRREAFALHRAAAAGIPSKVLRPRDFSSSEAWDEAFLAYAREVKAELIVLAGFLSRIGPKVLKAFPKHIINIHPSLLPLHGGPGFYGLRPHEAVIAAGEAWSGATVHYVSELYDQGDIILQERLAVRKDDCAETLQARIMQEIEQKILPAAVRMLAEKEKDYASID